MAGTDTSRPAVLGGPAVVLVRPQLGENIGAAARAMLNFGLTELRLVAPRDGWPSEQARAAASRLGCEPLLSPITMREVETRAARPRSCALSNGKIVAAGATMPTWEDALDRYLAVRCDSPASHRDR